MDVTFSIDGLDLHSKLSTYEVATEVSYVQTITTMDGVRHPVPGSQKDAIVFSLFPMTEDEATLLYNKLSQYIVSVSYTNPKSGTTLTRSMYVDGEITHTFALKSVDGKRRYLGDTITLREC